jgi:hypothetical protein
VVSLKPHIICKPVPHLKEEMMRKYEGDAYYFLKAHIDGVIRKGSLRILSVEMSTDKTCERLHMLAPYLYAYRSYTVVPESDVPPCTL